MFSTNLIPGIDSRAWLWHALGLFITVVSIAGFYLFVDQPMDTEIVQLHAREAELERLLNQASRIYADNNHLKTQVKEFERKAAEVLARVPEEPCEADFLAQVSQLAQKTGLDILDYRPGITRPQTTHTEMEVKLISKGSYPSLCGFLEQLDQLPRLCRLTNLSIDAKTNNGKYAMELTLMIFFTNQVTP